jgi:cysteinyl-tRNA synthetase
VFARYWLHNGFLTMDSEKMSKSLGNVLLLREILQHAPGEAVRLALLTGHYRQPLDWNDQALADAWKKLDRLYGALRDAGAAAPAPGSHAPQRFIEALEDDLNTPAALAELFELARALNRADSEAEKAQLKGQLLDAAGLLGILQTGADDWFKLRTIAEDQAAGTPGPGQSAPAAGIEPEWIEQQIAQRAAAKKARNFAEADRIRAQLKSHGVLIEDSPQGTRWRFTH